MLRRIWAYMTIKEMYQDAINKGLANKINEQNKHISFQQFVLYWVLRANATVEKEVDENFETLLTKACEDTWICKEWDKYPAINKDRTLNVSWGKVLDLLS